MKSVLSILSLVLLAGCYTQQKAIEQMDKAHSRYEVIAAGKCANWYPVKIDTVSGEIRYLPGKTQTIPGPTVFVNCDSIIKNPGSTNKARVPADCPPSELRVDTVEKPYYVTKENTAAVKEATLKLQESDKASRTKNGIIGTLSLLLIVSIAANILQFNHDRKS